MIVGDDTQVVGDDMAELFFKTLACMAEFTERAGRLMRDRDLLLASLKEMVDEIDRFEFMEDDFGHPVMERASFLLERARTAIKFAELP